MARVRPWERKNNLSSFMLPLIISLVVLLILIRAFFGGSSSTTQSENGSFVNVSPNQEKSEIYIYMSWDSKKQIDWSEKLYPTDNKLSVADWEWKITFDGWNQSKIYVSKLWEIKYDWNENWTDKFTLSNWDIWVESWKNNLKFTLRWLEATSSDQSVYSFTQNMVASSLYVLKWEVNVTLNTDSKAKKTATIWVGQKITILQSDLSKEDLNIQDDIEPIDDYFKEWDLYAKHWWQNYINQTNADDMSWTTTWSWTAAAKWGKILVFTYPEDEATVDTNVINIEWKITSSNIDKVTLNDKEVALNKDDMTFVAKDFSLDSTINNIVYKAYDKDWNLLGKWVLSVYSSSKDKASTWQDKPTVTTYPISSKDFRIIDPSENPYKTTEDIVKIAWFVNKWVVKFITINDFRLTKFPQFSSNWYYFANKDYWTMNDWINLYTIKYYGKDDELLNTSLFTIVKESTAPATDSTSSTWTTDATVSNNW